MCKNENNGNNNMIDNNTVQFKNTFCVASVQFGIFYISIYVWRYTCQYHRCFSVSVCVYWHLKSIECSIVSQICRRIGFDDYVDEMLANAAI